MADQDSVYAQFDAYDWGSFADFQHGLAEILQGHLEALQERDASVAAIPPAERQQLTDQAKSFFFCSATGHILNLDDYYAWKRRNKITLLDSEPGVVETKTEAGPGRAQPEPAAAETTADSAAAPAGPDDAPYSSNYQELVDLIVAGKPVPGIKEIPDTVLPGEQSAAQAAPRAKPWEKHA